MTEHSEDCGVHGRYSRADLMTGLPCDCGLDAMVAELKLLREVADAVIDEPTKAKARARADHAFAAADFCDAALDTAAHVAGEAHFAAKKRRLDALAALDAWRKRAAPKERT